MYKCNEEKESKVMEVLKSIGLFIQNQVLGMKWLNVVIRNGLSAIGVDISTRAGGSVQFFIYDVIKITVLLCLLIFAIYMGRFFSIKTDKNSENDTKVAPGVKNGMMTALVGIAICQAAIIVAQLCF